MTYLVAERNGEVISYIDTAFSEEYLTRFIERNNSDGATGYHTETFRLNEGKECHTK